MRKENNETQLLIDGLAGDLKPVKCMRHPLKRALFWVLFSGTYVVLVIHYLGLRPDFTVKLSDPAYLFEIFLAFTMSMSGVMSSHWLCVPDMRGQNWMPVVSMTLFTVLVGWLLLQLSIEFELLEHMHFSHCMVDGTIFGLIPAASIVFMSMGGKTTHPMLMIFMNIIAASGIGYMGLRLTCGCDNTSHIVIHHIVPYILMGGVIAALGQKLYRW
jgi:hypothetical protein